MNRALFFDFTVNKANNTISVQREFDAPVDMVWSAWTEPELLDQWWAPKPYRTVTKHMDFHAGGHWFYAMIGPENDTHWCRADYSKVEAQKSFEGMDAFCDEEGKINEAFPRTKWNTTFNANGETTTVDILLTYEKLEDLEQIISLGFREGFTMALGNLDQYFAAKIALRSSLKKDNKARTCTYLNFPGNTEEAFMFYQSVFKRAFHGGVQRFADATHLPPDPPMADHLKRMILHIELPITGNHILMGTDAPKEMGFTVTQGNNMHISLEPETREEADRIFNELSAGGSITMPLQDMFWGAYFGSFTDKFGINWMVNYLDR